jgi:hypothetical protein
MKSLVVDAARSSILPQIDAFLATNEALKGAGFVVDKSVLSLRERLSQQQEQQRLRTASNASDHSASTTSTSAAPIGSGKHLATGSAFPSGQSQGTAFASSFPSRAPASNVADTDLGDFDNPSAASVHGKAAVFAASFSNSLDESVQGRFQQQFPPAASAFPSSRAQPLKPPGNSVWDSAGGMDSSQRGIDSSRRGFVPPPPSSSRAAASMSASSFPPPSGTASAAANSAVPGVQHQQQPSNSFGGGFAEDPFAAFNASQGAFAATSVSESKLRSEVTLVYQEDIQCISRNGAVEKLDYHGTIHVELDNKNYPEGTVALAVKDNLAHVMSILPNQSVVKTPIVQGTDSRVKQTSCKLQGNKTSVGALRCTFVPSLRPLLFQARTSTTWSGAVATITVRISLNPNFKQPIDNFTILASVAHLAKVFPDATSAVVKSMVAKPSGGTHSASNSVVVWQCARLDPTKQAQLQFEAALEFPAAPQEASVTLSSPACAGPAVILKGGYNSSTLTAVEPNAMSVTFADGSVCKDFDLKVHRSKRLKFEYRFI